MLANKLMSALSGGTDKLYVDDVFSAFTYTGNGATQTINNGIDLAGKGGLVWSKNRSASGNHFLSDSARGLGSNSFYKLLFTDLTSTQNTTNSSQISSFNNNGYSLLETGANNFVSWTFRKAPKFFDVVTYVGNGTTNKSFTHSLSCEVGTVIIKRTDTTGDWWVYHRSISSPSDNYLLLNSSAAAGGFANWLTVTSTNITINVPSTGVNANGGTYVAYLFAHDPSADGIIQCGSFTTDGSGNATVNLGWEPQYLLIKATHAETWRIYDTMRGASHGTSRELSPNTSAAETNYDSYRIAVPNGVGFTSVGSLNPSSTYIYLAIRRPNKPPTTGTEVYNAIARAGTSSAVKVTGVGFSPDLCNTLIRSPGGRTLTGFIDRLRGLKLLQPYSANAEVVWGAGYDVLSLDMDGISFGSRAYTNLNSSDQQEIMHFFRRAPGVFDVVCYIPGTSAPTTQAHSLAAIPELVISKNRDNVVGAWQVYMPGIPTKLGELNSTAAFSSISVNTSSTISNFKSMAYGSSTDRWVSYLFATLPGISKVGSYTGNGTSQTINCGFTTGARFILIKRTDAAGDWYIWDTARGIVSANDPHLSMNTNAAEVTTDDSVDPEASGFIVNQVAATNINVSGGRYIFLVIA